MADLISFESKQLVFKSLNNHASQYICNLFQRNSDCSLQDLRRIGTDLRLPMNITSNGQKTFHTEEPYHGITLQVKLNRALPFSFKQSLLLDKKH